MIICVSRKHSVNGFQQVLETLNSSSIVLAANFTLNVPSPQKKLNIYIIKYLTEISIAEEISEKITNLRPFKPVFLVELSETKCEFGFTVEQLYIIHKVISKVIATFFSF